MSSGCGNWLYVLIVLQKSCASAVENIPCLLLRSKYVMIDFILHFLLSCFGITGTAVKLI